METPNYNLDALSDVEADKIVNRLLLMVHKKDSLFTCISDHIISEMMLQDLIEIDFDNETMEGTTLTEKGMLRLSKSLNQ